MISTLNHGVEARASLLGQGAGLGLFATRAFAKGALITECDGELIDGAEMNRRRQRGQATHIRSILPLFVGVDGAGLRATDTGRGGASFANDARRAEGNNSRFVQRRTQTGSARGGDIDVLERVFLQATRDIYPEEEILVSYGRAYWRLTSATLHAPRAV